MTKRYIIDGPKLKTLRAAKGFTSQASFAREVGISRSYLTEIEAGIKQPKKPVVTAMATALRCELSEITS